MPESSVSMIISITIVIVIVGIIIAGLYEIPENEISQLRKGRGGTYSTVFLDEDIKFSTRSEIIGNLTGVVKRSIFEDIRVSGKLKEGNYTHALLELEIHSAEPLGSLVFYSSGEIYRKIPRYGLQKVEIDPSAISSNWTAYAAPPALFFWKKTEYNFTATLKGLVRLEGYYSFFAKSSKIYTLIADIKKSSGGVDILLNKNVVYSGEENETIRVELENLYHKNVIEIVPWENSEYEFSYIYLEVKDS